MKCYFCSEEIDNNAPVCPWCGRRQERVIEKKPSKKEQLDQFIETQKELLSAIDLFMKLLHDKNNQQIWLALLKSDLINYFPAEFENIIEKAGSFTFDSSQFRSLGLNEKTKEFQAWSLPMDEDEFANLLQSTRKVTLEFKAIVGQCFLSKDPPGSEKHITSEETKEKLRNGFGGFSSVLVSTVQKMEQLSQVVKGLSFDLETVTPENKTLLERDSRPSKVCGVCYGKKEFPCSGCYESGACQLCNGQGEIKAMAEVNKDGDEIIRRTPCPACKGSGLCTICHGTKIMKCTNCGGTGLTSG